ncbi:MAG: hypothetical protein U0175_30980 [Caldilineaceae bacterium]
MSPQLGRAGLNLGVWVTLVSGVLLFFNERGSAEFYISLFTFLLGALFTIGIVIAIKLGQK